MSSTDIVYNVYFDSWIFCKFTLVKKSIYIILTLLLPITLWAQKGEKQLVQFSGFAMASDSMMGIPFVHIGVKGSSRVGTARMDGFFSFAVAEGDTLIFTCVGYKPSTYIVPSGNEDNKLSVIQLMNKDAVILRTVDIYPWGGKPGFHDYFVHVRIPKTLQDIARANTDRQLLAAIGASLPVDGGEVSERVLQYNAAQYSYYGEQAPQNIFNPLAWAEFIRALKNGDFKQKPAATAPPPQQDY
jgi:hypothetical protein